MKCQQLLSLTLPRKYKSRGNGNLLGATWIFSETKQKKNKQKQKNLPPTMGKRDKAGELGIN